MAHPQGEITGLLQAWRNGDANAFDALVPLVYQELRTLALWQMKAENAGHTLTPTGLLHESFLRLIQSQSKPDWQDRKHFFVVASRAMRNLLIDHARKKRAGKRDSADLADAAVFGMAASPVAAAAPWSVIDLDRALDKLQLQDARRAKMLELRHFGGLTVREIGEVLEVSAATVSRELRVTEAWLAHEIRAGMA